MARSPARVKMGAGKSFRPPGGTRRRFPSRWRQENDAARKVSVFVLDLGGRRPVDRVELDWAAMAVTVLALGRLRFRLARQVR
jgi:hypothetical protein